MPRDFDLDEMVRTDDGRPLILQTTDLYPVEFNDSHGYMRPPSPEAIYWLLTAAASGIIGNLGDDALKAVVNRAVQLYQEFSKHVPAERTSFMQLSRHGILEVDPPTELRDALIVIASETLRRYKQLSPSSGQEPWSDVDVRFSAYGTWMVLVREVGQDRSITIEIDLETGNLNHRPHAAGDDDGFPVRIWL